MQLLALSDSLRPFHFAFLVQDLDSTRRFYGEILRCREGRSSISWVDFDFFGNQISAHLTEAMPATRDLGDVDGVKVPMPHFGCVLDWPTFDVVAQQLRDAGVDFLIEPYIRFEGKASEQKTMFLRDFSGNALEFKGFRSESGIFASGETGAETRPA